MAENVTFSRRQRKYIEWLAADKFTRVPPTKTALAPEIGVSIRTLHRWDKIPDLNTEVNNVARQAAVNAVAQTYRALVREAEKGNFQHLKLLLEIAGEYADESEAAAVIIIQNEGATTTPHHLSHSANGNATEEAALQRGGVWPQVGQDGNGHRPSG